MERVHRWSGAGGGRDNCFSLVGCSTLQTEAGVVDVGSMLSGRSGEHRSNIAAKSWSVSISVSSSGSALGIVGLVKAVAMSLRPAMAMSV